METTIKQKGMSTEDRQALYNIRSNTKMLKSQKVKQKGQKKKQIKCRSESHVVLESS